MRFKSHLKAILIFFAFPIAIGTSIYLLFRPTNLVVFHWAESIGLYSLILAARENNSIAQNIPFWVVYSLPNGLWAFSLMFFISIIWGNKSGIEKTFFIVLVVMLSAGSEIGQLLGIIPGTFCMLDMLFNSGGVIIGYLAGRIYYRREYMNEDKKNNAISNVHNCVYIISDR